jgi:hypothetical protein
MSNPAARPPRSGWSNSSPLNNHARHKPGSAAAAAPSPSGRRARSPLVWRCSFSWLAPRAPGLPAGSLVVRGGSPHMGRPPRPPVQGMRGIEWPPRGRPPRTPTRHEPSATRPREQGRCCPGARCCPAVAPGSGWCRSSAPPARALLRARGGRWHMPGRGPAARGAGAVNGLFPASGERTSQKIGAARGSTSARTGQGQASAARAAPLTSTSGCLLVRLRRNRRAALPPEKKFGGAP